MLHSIRMGDLVYGLRKYSSGQDVPVGFETVKFLPQACDRDQGRRSECGPEDEGQAGDIEITVANAEDMFLVPDLPVNKFIQHHFSGILTTVRVIRIDRKFKGLP